jgi:hypothetical protein
MLMMMLLNNQIGSVGFSFSVLVGIETSQDPSVQATKLRGSTAHVCGV